MTAAFLEQRALNLLYNFGYNNNWKLFPNKGLSKTKFRQRDPTLINTMAKVARKLA